MRNGLAWVLMVCGAGAALGQSQTPDQTAAPPIQLRPNDANGAAAAAQKTDAQGKPVDKNLYSPATAEAVNKSTTGAALGVPAAGGTAARTMAVGTVLHVHLHGHLSSGTLQNGTAVQGVLAQAAQTSRGVLPAGTPVTGTVVSSAKAGAMRSGGVLSLQLTQVGVLHVITSVAEFDGAEGHKDVADAAPAKGTEAVVPAHAVVTFTVLENGHGTGLANTPAPAGAAGPQR